MRTSSRPAGRPHLIPIELPRGRSLGQGGDPLSEALAAVGAAGHSHHVLGVLEGRAVAPRPGVAGLGGGGHPPVEAVRAGDAAGAHPPGQEQAGVAGVPATVGQPPGHVDEVGLGAGGGEPPLQPGGGLDEARGEVGG